ncbi:MAG TPA: hypothetical protein VML55_05465 [Planctomycetaceae bacterium]|nr:hypothetical protein [Planctomycetaceae bacterium]
MFPRSRGWIAAVAVLLAVSAGYAAWRVHQHHTYKHFAVHEPGMMYRSAWLDADAFTELIEEHQLRTIVNLCESDERTADQWAEQRRAVESAGARLMVIPMPTSVSVTAREIGRHLELLGDPDNYPMLVHCQHGVTRTAKFLAIYDIAFRNMTAGESLAAQPLFGRDEHNVHVRAFVRKFEKRHRALYQAAVPEKLDVLRD